MSCFSAPAARNVRQLPGVTVPTVPGVTTPAVTVPGGVTTPSLPTAPGGGEEIFNFYLKRADILNFLFYLILSYYTILASECSRRSSR